MQYLSINYSISKKVYNPKEIRQRTAGAVNLSRSAGFQPREFNLSYQSFF
jgi:hypothetical protein